MRCNKYLKSLFLSLIVIIITVSMTSCSVFSSYISNAVREAIEDSKTEYNPIGDENSDESATEFEESSNDTQPVSQNPSEVEFMISDSNQLMWRKSGSNGMWNPVSSTATADKVVLRINNGTLQWGYENSNEWQDLFKLESLQSDNINSLSFRINDGYLQYGNSATNEWTNLIPADQINISDNTKENNIEFAANYTMRSVVSVFCTYTITQKVGGFWYNDGEKTQTSTATTAGSGVIYKLNESTGEAYIITNYHVVYKSSSDTGISDNIKVYIYGSESEQYAIPAKYVGGAMAYDIAVLHVESSEVLAAGYAKAADIGDSNQIYVGDSVVVTGNPEGTGISVNSGIINVDSEYRSITLADDKTTASMRLIRVDAAINPGNSGGGLFDLSGKLIGIPNSKLVSTDVENFGHAIPSNVAVNIADSIIYYCDGQLNTTPKRCLLGITLEVNASEGVYNPDTQKSSIIEEVIISEISDTSILKDKAQPDDILKSISINGKNCEITRIFAATDFMMSARVGDTVVLNLERNGQPVTITVTLTDNCLNSF